MRVLQEIVSETVVGMRNMLFPGVCLSCGDPVIDGGDLLCPFCQESKFDLANPWYKDTCGGVILPDIVRFQHALWLYDKGGILQRLLHSIKYSGMGKLGYELGKLTGSTLSAHPAYHLLSQQGPVQLLPVPLHPRRKRIRGFNQAELIAMGISDATGIPVVEDHLVERRKFTQTQTGFSLQQRSQNLSSAFHVTEPAKMAQKMVIIVDDVFTTGATTFVLAEELRKAQVASVAVVTVALA